MHWLRALSFCLACYCGFGCASVCHGQTQPAIAEPNPLVEVLVRDRRWPVLLNTVANNLQAEKYDDAAELLQRCFGSAEDGFVLRPEWPEPAARAIAHRLFREAGEKLWEAYEKRYGIEARQSLAAVQQDGIPGGYYSVIRRYEHTAAGADSLNRLASWHFGRGDFDSALTCWKQLFANPVHERRLTAAERMKLVIAAQRVGNSEVVQRESQLLGKARVSIGGKSLTAAEWLIAFEKLPVRKLPHPGDWRLLGGSPQRSRISSGSAPFLRPSTSISMFDPGQRPAQSAEDRQAVRVGREQLEQDVDQVLASGVPVGYAGTPIVKGNLILWRDVFGVTAVDRESRKVIWSRSAITPLHSLMILNNDSESRRIPQPTYTRNSVLEQLTSDGQYVYFVDDSNAMERNQGPLFNGRLEPMRGEAATPPPWNRVVALRLNGTGDTGREAWQIGGHPVNEPQAVLSGHYFLGPPLPLGGLLYAITENQRLISLTALQPETGKVVWHQTLAFVPQPARDFQMPLDRRRLSQATFLAAARGNIICPLTSGVIIAVNQLTGEISWIQDYRSRTRRTSFPYSPFSHNINEQVDEGEFPNPPLIQGDRIYFLGPGDNIATDQMFCFDLFSGKKHWQVDCPELKYLGSVADGLLLAVGANEVLGLATENGSIKWNRRVPRISGVGAAVHGLYLLPVAEGRVLSLDPRDGSEVGFSMQVPGIRPGNLVVSGQDIISLNGVDLQIFPQAAELLASLEARPPDQRDSYNYWYELGELQFRLGQVKAAKANLTKALGLAMDSPTQSSVRAVLREVAWHELGQQPESAEQRQQILAEYSVLSETPEQQAQFLLLQGEEQIRTGQLNLAQQTAGALLNLEVDQPLKLLNEPDREITTAVWVAEIANRARRGGMETDQLLPGESAPLELLRRSDMPGLSRLLQQHPYAAWAPAARLGLARLMMQNGQLQAAELEVWQDHLEETSAGLEACKLLLEMWEPNGLIEESGLILHRIGTRLAEIKGDNGQTGREFYENFPRSSLIWPAARRFIPVDWPVKRVQITERNEYEPRLRSTFSTTPRYLHFPQSSQQLVVRGHTLTNTLQQVDIETGSVVANITLPPSSSNGFFQIFDMRNRIGHFLPLGGAASCYGVSLLERGMAWNLDSTAEFRLNNLIRVGPCTSSVCVFRSRDRLYALNPASGQLLWHRDDLEEGSRMNNALTAIPGDGEVIVLLEPDSKGYRLYKTADGSFLRQGRLDDCVYISQQFGRNLLYSTEQDQKSVKLWDPLEGKVLFQARQMVTPIATADRDQDFTVAEKSGLIRIVEGSTGRVKLEVQLSPNEFQAPQPAPLVRSFTDGTRYYINVHRQIPPNSQNTSFSDAIFPTYQVTGDLHAIDPATSQVIWTRPRISQQNIVNFADYRLPFLVSLSRWRASQRGNSQQLLRVDVIDGESGQLLETHNNGFGDKLLLTDYDRDAGRLRIRGAVTQFYIDFGRNLNLPDPPQDEFVSRQLAP